jgi:ComF family protein
MAPFATRFRDGWGAVADTLFPQACLGCRQTLFGPGREWCATCVQELLKATGRLFCPTCGRDVGPYEVVDGRCGRCSLERWSHDGLVRVAAYEGLFRGLMRQYKFARQERLDKTFGRMLAERIEGVAWRPAVEAIVPVPSHWTVRRARGFFSTGAFAREAARHLGVEYLHLLRRPRRGRSQIGLSRTDRRANVRGMFALRRGACVAGRTLCLIDDVMVTGATLHENVRLLKESDAKAVYVAVLAKPDSANAALVDV